MTGMIAGAPLLALMLLVLIHVVALAVAGVVIARGIEAAHPPGGRFVALPGGAVHLYDLAPNRPDPTRHSPPILLLHGATSNARDMLLALGPELAKRHRVIIPDRPGHGWSQRPRGAADPARQADTMAALLDRLDVPAAIVVGYSWSGALATALALNHPRRVAGLVLVAGVTHPWPGGIAWYYRLAALPVLGWLFTRLLVAPLGSVGFDRRVDDSFHPQPARPGYAEASAASLVLRPSNFAWNGQDVAALLGRVREQAPRLGKIAVPTAVVAGLADRTVSPELHARGAAAQIPGARLTLLPGVGHMPHHVAADVVAAEILAVAERALQPLCVQA